LHKCKDKRDAEGNRYRKDNKLEQGGEPSLNRVVEGNVVKPAPYQHSHVP
jgi:hypothetical protein